ncbi:hypothetical protein DXG01_002275 [Tephrocybe rancida]|nr:hypothetical protein DXG01_002275 [Tephrocybe rancida]
MGVCKEMRGGRVWRCGNMVNKDTRSVIIRVLEVEDEETALECSLGLVVGGMSRFSASKPAQLPVSHPQTHDRTLYITTVKGAGEGVGEEGEMPPNTPYIAAVAEMEDAVEDDEAVSSFIIAD